MNMLRTKTNYKRVAASCLMLVAGMLGVVFMTVATASADTPQLSCTPHAYTAGTCLLGGLTGAAAAKCDPQSPLLDKSWAANEGACGYYDNCVSSPSSTVIIAGGDVCAGMRAAQAVLRSQVATTSASNGAGPACTTDASCAGRGATTTTSSSSSSATAGGTATGCTTDASCAGQGTGGSACSPGSTEGCKTKALCVTNGGSWSNDTSKCGPCTTTAQVGVACLENNGDSAVTKPTTCDRNSCDLIDKYINPFIKLLSAAVGVVIVIAIIVGGIQYGSSAGDPQKASAAKNHIRDAIIALLAFLFLYAALNFLLLGGLGR